MKEVETTLLLVIKDTKVLLALKKRGFGAGLLNGIGGKREADETITQTMIRETQEEIGVTPKVFMEVGIINFEEYYNGEKELIKMHVFIANDYDGEVQETEEMKPCWYDLDKIPYDNMFKDDRVWLPLILEGNKVKVCFIYDQDFNVLQHTIDIVDEL